MNVYSVSQTTMTGLVNATLRTRVNAWLAEWFVFCRYLFFFLTIFVLSSNWSDKCSRESDIEDDPSVKRILKLNSKKGEVPNPVRLSILQAICIFACFKIRIMATTIQLFACSVTSKVEDDRQNTEHASKISTTYTFLMKLR